MPTITAVTKPVFFKGAPGPPKPGAQVFFSDDLRDPQTQAKLGTHSGSCKWLRETPEDIHECEATCVFEEGQVTIRGAFDFSPNAPALSKYAITGGTDAYANARGEVTVEQLTQESSRLVFDIRL